MAIKKLIFLLILFPIGYSCQTIHINIDSELLSLKEADKKWADVCALKDIERMLDFYDNDGYNIDPQGNVHRGKDELRKLWANEFAKPDYLLTWELKEAYVARYGDIGFTTGSWSMKFTSKTGKQLNYNGTYVAIWKKQSDGSWKVLVDKS